MPFPTGWPPRTPSGVRSIRFFVDGTATADFADNGFLFADDVGANTFTPLPVVAPGDDRSKTVVVSTVPPVPGTGENQSDPKRMIWSGTICVRNNGAAVIEISFDGTNVHGRIPANAERIYRNRFEAGIAVRGAGMAFVVEAW